MTDYRHIPGWLIPPFVIGSASALGGAYWDDATHTETGRDSFFIPPHIAIYAGVMLAGIALGIWAFLFVQRNGLEKVREQRSLVLAIVSVLVTMAAGPIDNFWHLAFGRDAVLWSPPHVLGIVGTTGIAIAVLVELVRSDRRWALWLRPVAGGLALAALVVTVMEYDTDVPQFDPVWYLPVLSLASAFGLGVVKLIDGRRFSASAAALVHLVFIGLVSLFLLALGFDTPKMPMLLVPALVLDLLISRRAPTWVAALGLAVAIYVAYIPLLNLTGQGVRLDRPDIELGLPLAFVAAAIALAVIRPGRISRGPVALSAASTALVFLVGASSALAHDPGQGKLAGTVDLSAKVAGKHISVRARPHLIGTVDAFEIVGRRAGVVTRAPLKRSGGVLVGALDVATNGRWFVYVDVGRNGKRIESWLPVKAGEGEARFSKRGRFAYLAKPKHSSPVKRIAGVLLYAVVIGLLAAIVLLARSALPGGRPAAGGSRGLCSDGQRAD